MAFRRKKTDKIIRTHWYAGLIRHFRPDVGFRTRLLLVIEGHRLVSDLPEDRLQAVGPYRAAVETIELGLQQVNWYSVPGEIRVNDPALASHLFRTARWYDLQTITNDHEELETARKALEVEGQKGIARWLCSPDRAARKNLV